MDFDRYIKPFLVICPPAFTHHKDSFSYSKPFARLLCRASPFRLNYCLAALFCGPAVICLVCISYFYACKIYFLIKLLFNSVCTYVLPYKASKCTNKSSWNTWIIFLYGWIHFCFTQIAVQIQNSLFKYNYWKPRSFFVSKLLLTFLSVGLLVCYSIG